MFIRKSTLIWLVSGLVVLALVGGSLYVGFRIGQQDPKVITVKNITNIDDPDVKADFGVFWQVWEKLREFHINGEEVEELDLVYGAVSGLAEAMGDPHTVFLPPSDAKKFEEDVSGSFGGIGAEIGLRDGRLVIIAPLKDSPAERAGLEPLDIILEVDGQSTDGMDLNESVKIIRGELGTEVVLTVFREDWEDTKEISIIREVIKVPTIDWDIKEGNILHLRLYAFNENVPQLFHRAIIEGLTEGAEGLVLDLRNNPGGFLEIAVHLMGWFVEDGSVVVTEDFRIGQDIVFKASGNEALKDFPVVVLVNNGSASASEIVAGALRDLRGVKLIGEQTFGKGTVQELQKLKDNSSLKITIAKWVFPAGGTLEDEGLEPDIEVELTREILEEEGDIQLEKAYEVLREEIAG